MSTTALLVFGKEVRAGTVKTRLHDRLSPKEAAGLYQAFVRDTARLARSAGVPIRWYVAGKAAEAPAGDLFEQRGDSLGERLESAFRETAEAGFEGAVVIGTDSPNLPSELLGDALEAVQRPGAVIGPAFDGGYYLLGLQQVDPSFFKTIRYSRPTVFLETKRALDAAGAEVHVLPEWYDVDDSEDLDRLAGDLRQRPDAAPHTHEALVGLGILAE